tara:strand:+ start:7896 stop:8057 length:162 start_codon:yes stop_codon:yes gene_type:complete
MAEVLYRAVTWGLLGIFVSFLAYGVMVAAYTLTRFYKVEFMKFFSGLLTKPSE